MSATLYGIPNCDTVKKARRWMDEHGQAYRFHDIRQQALQPAQLQGWMNHLGRDRLINQRGTTWRQLPGAERRIASDSDAVALLLAHPTVMKRPVLESGELLFVGFDEAEYTQLLRRRAA